MTTYRGLIKTISIAPSLDLKSFVVTLPFGSQLVYLDSIDHVA